MDFYISILVGISQAFILNPIDKAIYNSIINKTKLLKYENWKKPFTGTNNGIISRIISGGIYFYLIEHTKNMNIYSSALYVSLTTSLIINPLNVIKYNSYINNKSTYNSFLEIYKKNGLKFCRIGLESLIMRDLIFNIIYIKYKKNNNDLIYNCGIICSASIISSPFHYIRNIKYYKNDSYINICKQLFIDIKNNNNKVNYIIKQFGIGYGTIRTILSVYLGQVMYSNLKILLY